MQFSHILAKHGCKITFLTSDENYNKMKTTSIIGGKGKIMESHINLVSLPDGVNPQDDRKDVAKVILSTKTTMSAMLPKVIEEINNINCDNKISCIIVTKNMGWALEVAHQLGIKGALFWPASATCLVSFNSMESLVEEGIIDSQNGKKYFCSSTIYFRHHGPDFNLLCGNWIIYKCCIVHQLLKKLPLNLIVFTTFAPYNSRRGFKSFYLDPLVVFIMCFIQLYVAYGPINGFEIPQYFTKHELICHLASLELLLHLSLNVGTH